LLFEGRILFKGTPPELAQNTIVKEKYLGSNFVLRPKNFQMIEEKKKREQEDNA
jgi:lipopolysaccharide export system ATP-binding protein